MKQLWTLHDHHRIKTVKAKRGLRADYRRQISSTSTYNASDNLGFIPEYSTLPTRHGSSVTSDYGTLPSKIHTSDDRGQNNDNLNESTVSASDLRLDLSDFDNSLSTDQFLFGKASPSKKFYEAFGTPRTSSIHSPDGLNYSFTSSNTADDSNLSYSYPNLSLPIQSATHSPPIGTKTRQPKDNLIGSRRRYTKHRTNSLPPDPAQLFSQTLPLPMNSSADLWSSNSSIERPHAVTTKLGKMRFGNSRVSYLTQLKLGETVRLEQAEKKKRKRLNLKGTIRYAFRSDVGKG